MERTPTLSAREASRARPLSPFLRGGRFAAFKLSNEKSSDFPFWENEVS